MRCTLNEKVLPRFDAGFYGPFRLCTESDLEARAPPWPCARQPTANGSGEGFRGHGPAGQWEASAHVNRECWARARGMTVGWQGMAGLVPLSWEFDLSASRKQCALVGTALGNCSCPESYFWLRDELWVFNMRRMFSVSRERKIWSEDSLAYFIFH